MLDSGKEFNLFCININFINKLGYWRNSNDTDLILLCYNKPLNCNP